MFYMSAEERQFPCERCGDVFRSKVALRRHETYVCNNQNAIFTTINRGFRENQYQSHHRADSEQALDNEHNLRQLQQHHDNVSNCDDREEERNDEQMKDPDNENSNDR